MRVQCAACLRNATHEYRGEHMCDNCAPYEDEDDETVVYFKSTDKGEDL